MMMRQHHEILLYNCNEFILFSDYQQLAMFKLEFRVQPMNATKRNTHMVPK